MPFIKALNLKGKGGNSKAGGGRLLLFFCDMDRSGSVFFLEECDPSLCVC